MGHLHHDYVKLLEGNPFVFAFFASFITSQVN